MENHLLAHTREWLLATEDGNDQAQHEADKKQIVFITCTQEKTGIRRIKLIIGTF